jgi:hypothetical protein
VLTAIPWLLADSLILLALGFLGFLTVRLISPQADTIEQLAAAFPAGAGVFSFVIFIASWAGAPIRLPTLLAVYVVLLLAVLASTHFAGSLRRVPSERPPAEPSAMGRLALWAVIVTVTAVAAAISVGRSYTPFDASAIWASKGYGIALEGSVFAGQNWGAHRLSYPLNVPLLIGIFQLVDGDLLPGSKLLFPLFFGSMLVGAVGFWRRLEMRPAWVFAGVLLLATVPEVLRHATYGYVNLPAATYLALGTMWGVLGLVRGNRGNLAVAGLLLGLGCWTRVEGLFYAAAITAALAISWAIRGRSATFPVLPLILPIILIGGAWLGFYRTYGLEGSNAGNALAAAISAWRTGEFQLRSIRLILGYFRREILNVETWGLIFPIAAAFVLLRWRRIVDRATPEVLPLALATLACGLATAGLFYIGSFDRGDLVGWLTRGFPRAFFPAAFLMVILAVDMAGAGSGRLADASASFDTSEPPARETS